MNYGSLNNLCFPSGKDIKPEAGMPVTEVLFSDRRPFTVIKVSNKGTTVTIQEDSWKRVDNNGMDECQEYTYTPNPEGRIVIIRLTKNGWTSKGIKYSLGRKEYYYDYTR